MSGYTCYRQGMSARTASISVTLDPADPEPVRVAIWRDVMRLVGEIRIPDPANFAGHFVSMNFGDIRTVRVSASTFHVHRDRVTGFHVPREHVIINLIEQGTVEGRIAGKPVAMAAGDIVLSRTNNSLDLLQEDATWLGIVIPRDLIEPHLHWPTRFDGTVHRAGTLHGILLGGLIRSLCTLPETLTTRDTSRATNASLTMIAACLGDAVAVPRNRVNEREATARAIRRFILDRLADPALGIGLISQEFGLSRSALYRLMGERGDIATVIRILRLQAIARDLGSDHHAGQSLHSIARRWGFTDDRSFRRAFTRQFGHPPSALRDGIATEPMLGPVSAHLHHWFLGT